MNDDVRQELKDWFEFYRELGIEDFYRRAPEQRVGMPKPAELRVEPGREPTPAPTVAPTLAEQKMQLESVRAPAVSARPVMPSQKLSLFEAAAPAPARRERETLEQIREDLGECHRCKLAGGRKTIVFGQGNPHAEVVFVGEGPGADEDEQGLPFVGRAGQLLNKMIQLVGMKREEVYIANIVKCRPPGNRVPEKDEIETCSPFLYRQIEAIRPRLVCCLGAPAVRTLLGIKEGITKIRGQFYDFAGTKALATVHPAYVLRNPREEKILREDFEKIRDFLKAR
ncbi:MAG: uracil-DNA glycosylase [Terriglobia bacterium]|jgi:DNA polymerase